MHSVVENDNRVKNQKADAGLPAGGFLNV
jgi:hypothetical protein